MNKRIIDLIFGEGRGQYIDDNLYFMPTTKEENLEVIHKLYRRYP